MHSVFLNSCSPRFLSSLRSGKRGFVSFSGRSFRRVPHDYRRNIRPSPPRAERTTTHSRKPASITERQPSECKSIAAAVPYARRLSAPSLFVFCPCRSWSVGSRWCRLATTRRKGQLLALPLSCMFGRNKRRAARLPRSQGRAGRQARERKGRNLFSLKVT